MGRRWAVVIGGVCVVWLAVLAAVVQAQYPTTFWMDDFSDGQLYSPPPFDPCDPCWIEKLVMADSWAFGIDNGRLRITTVVVGGLPFTWYGGTVSDYLPMFDPNKGSFDRSAPHWHLSNVRTHDDNHTAFTGMTAVWFHADVITDLRAYAVSWEPQNGWVAIGTLKGFTGTALVSADRDHWGYPQNLLDPNNHNGQSMLRDPMIPLWTLAEYDPNGTHHDPNYPNDPNDPNCHWIRGAFWTGARDDWNGYWAFETNIIGPLYPGAEMGDAATLTTFPFDPNTMMDLYVHPNGYMAYAGYGGGNTYDSNTATVACDASYDDMENFWGYAKDTFSWTLSLTVLNSGMGSVVVTPNQPSYANGTQVVLDAVPNANKSLKYWKVFHKNYPDDANYATESNDPQLILTMNGDTVVEAKFKCGSSEMLPPVAAALLGLAGVGLIRRYGTR